MTIRCRIKANVVLTGTEMHHVLAVYSERWQAVADCLGSFGYGFVYCRAHLFEQILDWLVIRCYAFVNTCWSIHDLSFPSAALFGLFWSDINPPLLLGRLSVALVDCRPHPYSRYQDTLQTVHGTDDWPALTGLRRAQ